MKHLLNDEKHIQILLELMIAELTHKERKALFSILQSFITAKEQHPVWPDDIIYQDQIFNEEKGELTKAILDYKFHGKDYIEVIKESAQAGAMGLRFLSNQKIQHEQEEIE